MSTERRSRLRRRLLALLLGIALALTLAELGVRWLVLSDSALARRLGKGVRHAEWLASPNDDAYWQLVFGFEHPVGASEVYPDRMTGWLTSKISPNVHDHVDARALGDRTPVLLYGDSFAEGVLPGPETFEGLLESSPLHTTHVLLNYGVGGFGADQVLLMARDTLPRWEARKSIAILSLLVDDDLDRAVLSFRGGPKPRFHVENGQLVEPEPLETNLERFLDQHPLGITSYIFRLFCRAPGLLPQRVQAWLRGDDSRLAEKQALAEAIVRATCRELRAHAQRSALMLMRARESVVSPSRAKWQEQLIRRVAAEEGLPVLDTRDVLLRAIDGKLEHLDNLYVLRGPTIGHWNAQGNLVVFQSMRAFVEGGTPQDAQAYVAQLLEDGELTNAQARRLESTALGGAIVVEFREDADALCFLEPRTTGAWYMGLRAGNQGPTSLRWTLPPGRQRLTVWLRAPDAAQPAQGAQEIVLHAGQRIGRELAGKETLTLRVGEPAREWSLELQGGGALELRVDPPPGGGRSPWILLEKARLE
jgi:hypothetical protein